jgi:hypothetical protein
MSTRNCRSKIMHLTDFLSALPQNATAAQWFKTHGTRDVPHSIRRWVATMSTPHYTVRQIPRNSPRGSVIKRVVAVHQPNNTLSIGIPRTPRVRTPSPRYTVRQSPTQGAVRRAVTVVRQPNNTMNIGVPRIPPVRHVTRVQSLRRRIRNTIRSRSVYNRRSGARPTRRM